MDAKLLVFLLSVSQVFATSLLHLRSPEILQSRQYGCSSCTTAAKTFSNCRSIECVCNPGFVADLQSCFNCAVAANPSPDVISPIQKVIENYARFCPDVPRITILPGTTQTGTSISIIVSESVFTSSTIRSTPTPTPTPQTNGDSGTTLSEAGAGATGVPSSARLAAFGAMVGVALVL